MCVQQGSFNKIVIIRQMILIQISYKIYTNNGINITCTPKKWVNRVLLLPHFFQPCVDFLTLINYKIWFIINTIVM